MIHDFAEYQTKVARTMSGDGDANLRLAVWAMGLSGEAAEVLDYFDQGGGDLDILTKELGDVCWYISALCEHNGFELGHVAGEPLVSDFLDTVLLDESVSRPDISLSIAAGSTVDYIKKVVGHGHDLDRDRLQRDLRIVLHLVAEIAESQAISLEDVLGRNIAKLEKRYKAGFSTEASKARVDQA